MVKNIPIIRTLIDSLKTVCQTNMSEIPHYVDMLEAAAKKASVQKDVFYVASLVLYCLKINIVNLNSQQYIMDRQRLMQLSCSLGNIFQRQLRIEAARDSYRLAVMLGGEVPSLKSTPIYEYAYKKMSEVELKITLGLSRSRVPITIDFQNDSQSSNATAPARKPLGL